MYNKFSDKVFLTDLMFLWIGPVFDFLYNICIAYDGHENGRFSLREDISNKILKPRSE